MAGTDRPQIILIAGPTASGKSALALDLAERLGGAVVNANSMQVYRDLRILTSRPSAGDESRVPHLLYGHVDAAEPHSVGRFLTDAERVIRDNHGALVFVGGTGLHFDALTKGLSTAPPIPDAVRARWRERGLAEPSEALHAELARRDPGMAERLRPSDPQRVLRALEVIDATGISLAHWQQSAGTPLVDPARATRIVLRIDRAELRARIAARFSRMMEEGALDEVRRLLGRKLDPALPAMKAIGVPPLAAHLRGEAGFEAAVERAITDTRQYAKRQETWFRNRLRDWPHLSPEEARKGFLGGNIHV